MRLLVKAGGGLFFALVFITGGLAQADPYRDLDLKIRTSGAFQVPMPGGPSQAFSYQMDWGNPIYQTPLTANFLLSAENSTYFIRFWDRLLLKDGSFLRLGDTKVPLTCVFVDGQDNTKAGITSPLQPDHVLKVYLVANDFSCIGPINPLWPAAGVRRETWDTYLYFEIRDTTIMTPTEVKIRYRWNEFPAVLVDGGGH